MLTLAMAQPVEAAIANRLNNLASELNNAMEVSYPKDGEPAMPERSVEQILVEMDKVQADLLKLRAVRNRANIEALVQWRLTPDAPFLTVAEAIELAKRMRARLSIYQSMASKNVNPTTSRWAPESVTVITYIPSNYRVRAEELERQVNALSLAIDAANGKTDIDFDASGYLEGLI